MRQLPPRGLTPVGTAIAKQMAVDTLVNAPQPATDPSEELQAQIDLARLKLEMKPAARDLNRQMLANVEAKLQEAVDRFMGFPVTDPQQIAGRLAHRDDSEGRTFYIDQTPVLFVGRADIDMEGTVLQAKQEVRHLLPEDYQPAAAGGIILP